MTDQLSFDPDAFELRRNGEPVELEPQALSVAAYLMQHRHRLISKEELLDEIWGDRFVSESALSTRIKQIRRAVGDSGAEQRIIKTIHGKGYRFVGEIEICSEEQEKGSTEASGPGRSPTDDLLHNLPTLRTEMIGRDEQTAIAVASIGRNRLTTLVGVGGVGKTTLATAVGREILESFPDGVFFVDLVPVADAEQLMLGLTKAAGLSLQSGPPLEQVARIITDRQMLFVLDNCESALEAVTSTVDFLLGSTQGPRFLLTSREALGLPDEARIIVETLPASGPAAPAVELLGRCAERFGVSDLDPQLASEVCRELDGLPLAIELAAAQLRHLSLNDLASRLDRRFDLLVVPHGDRHASLSAVLESTWASISHPEREVLRQLAVAPSALGLDGLIHMMEQPEEATLASLARLIDCSLVVRSGDTSSRYQLLESVRVFARDSDLDHQATRRDRLAGWCLETVGTDVTRHAFDFGLAQWCAANEHTLDAAETHLGAERPHEAAMLIAGQGLATHLDDGSRAADVLTRIGQHLDRVDDSILRARLHITGAFSAMAARNPTLLASHGINAVSEARRSSEPSVLAIALVLESWSAVRDPAHALELVTEAATIADAAGDKRSLDLANGYRAWHLTVMQQYDEAVHVAQDVLATKSTEPGYETMCAAAALATCLAPREPDHALEVYKQNLNRPGASSMMANELLLAASHGANADAPSTARIVLSVHQRLQRSGQHALPDVLVPTAMLARALGDDDRAHLYWSAVRRSDRPTQSLQVTCLYQQLRLHLEETGNVEAPDESAASTDEVGDEALAWLSSLLPQTT